MGGTRVTGRNVIRSEKWENHKNSTHTKIKFYIFLFPWWILKFLPMGRGVRGAGKGQAGVIIHSEKWENHKNSTHTKIKFQIIITRFFFMMDIKIFLTGGRAGRGFLRLIFFYFINAIILRLHISSFIVVYIDIWHIVTVCYILMFFPHLKSTLLATKMYLLPQLLT